MQLNTHKWKHNYWGPQPLGHQKGVEMSVSQIYTRNTFTNVNLVAKRSYMYYPQCRTLSSIWLQQLIPPT